MNDNIAARNCGSHGPEGATCAKEAGHTSPHGGMSPRGDWLVWWRN